MKTLITFCLALLTILPTLAHAESAYERVMKSGTIKCGYGLWPPFIEKDPNTNEVKGIVVDIMELIADQLDLTLDWSYESGWATLPTDIQTGKVDMACSTLWNDPKRGKKLAFTDPVFFMPIYAFARADDERFFTQKPNLNSPDVTISAQDGGYGISLAKRKFPKAEIFSIPQTAQWSEIFNNVTTGKADVVIVDSVVVKDFNKENEKKLKRIESLGPIVVYGNSYALAFGDRDLAEMIETTITYLNQSGEIEKILESFRQENPGSVFLVSKPYKDE